MHRGNHASPEYPTRLFVCSCAVSKIIAPVAPPQDAGAGPSSKQAAGGQAAAQAGEAAGGAEAGVKKRDKRKKKKYKCREADEPAAD